MVRLILIFLIFIFNTAHAVGANSPTSLGYRALDFSIAEAGSYRLQNFGKAYDGAILDSSGKQTTLHHLYNDKVSILGFVYLNCGDINGCPLTTFVVSQLKSEIEKIEELSDNVRLISLSFDPERDTPKALSGHGVHMGANNKLWSLVTTKSQEQLQPLLKDYNQAIQRMYKNGKETGEITHILRVYLIDKQKNIRNIYSTAFLHKDILLNDIKTILLEQDPSMSFTNKKYSTQDHQHKNHDMQH